MDLIKRGHLPDPPQRSPRPGHNEDVAEQLINDMLVGESEGKKRVQWKATQLVRRQVRTPKGGAQGPPKGKKQYDRRIGKQADVDEDAGDDRKYVCLKCGSEGTLGEKKFTRDGIHIKCARCGSWSVKWSHDAD